MHSRPLLDTPHQALLDPMAQNVPEASHLHLLLVADHDRLIPATPHLLPPAGPAADLLGQVRGEVAHEVTELLRIVHPCQEVEVVRHEDIAHEIDRVKPLSASEDATNDVVELRGGHEQQTPLDGSAGHLDEGPAVWDEAQMATHAH